MVKITLCKNHEEEKCPNDCTFWDCQDFEPTEYFLSGIKELKEVK